MRTNITLAALLVFCASAAWGRTDARSELGRPDLEKISAATTDESSPYYYPRLLRAFMANDTTMSAEDYDPYRASPNPALLEELTPIYAKERRSRADREKMLDYAMQVLNDNPVDLRQLTNRIYVYEQNAKFDLAKIWQYKLNHLLLVIAASGTGSDAENAWTVVYPQQEYDFLNLSGITATGQHFEPPHYDYIMVEQRNDSDCEGYFFNIGEMLKQYFLKHPGELQTMRNRSQEQE